MYMRILRSVLECKMPCFFISVNCCKIKCKEPPSRRFLANVMGRQIDGIDMNSIN